MTDARKLWTSGSKVPVHVDTAEIADKARTFRRRATVKNAMEYVAGALVVPIFVGYAVFPERSHLPLVTRIGSLMIAVGAVVVLAYLWRKAGGGAKDLRWGDTTLQAYRRQLERRRDLMLSVPRWYLGPFIPGFIVFMAGMATHERAGRAWPHLVVTMAVSVATFVGIALFNRWGARKLDAEIAALPPDETSTP